MASKLGFRKVIGVEFSPFAYKVAQDNLMNFRSRHDKLSECLFVNEDAVKFELPSDRSWCWFLTIHLEYKSGSNFSQELSRIMINSKARYAFYWSAA
jgi:hypothetical protein